MEPPANPERFRADTTTPHGRPMLAMLGGLAKFERELIKVRTGEG
ncbi:MAG: recombinase family protein, partial [Acetobacteraceae bacterium]